MKHLRLLCMHKPHPTLCNFNNLEAQPTYVHSIQSSTEQISSLEMTSISACIQIFHAALASYRISLMSACWARQRRIMLKISRHKASLCDSVCRTWTSTITYSSQWNNTYSQKTQILLIWQKSSILFSINFNLSCDFKTKCTPVWSRSAHTSQVDVQLNSTMHLISATLHSTPLPWLPVLSNIEPSALRRKTATDKLVEKIVKHDSWPIQPDILKGKGKGLDTCYSATYMSGLVTSSAFTISKVAADWHEPIVPQRTM